VNLALGILGAVDAFAVAVPSASAHLRAVFHAEHTAVVYHWRCPVLLQTYCCAQIPLAVVMLAVLDLSGTQLLVLTPGQQALAACVCWAAALRVMVMKHR
jgi:hypothetical protein